MGSINLTVHVGIDASESIIGFVQEGNSRFVTVIQKLDDLLREDNLKRTFDDKTDIKLDKIIKSLHDQTLKRPQELQNIQHNIQRNKEHVKKVEVLLEEQNSILNTLSILVRSLSNQSNQDISLYSFPKPDLAPSDLSLDDDSFVYIKDDPDLKSPEITAANQPDEEPSQFNPFLESVFSAFNKTDIDWFASRIQDGIFRKAQIPRYTLSGIDPGSTLIELSDHGVYLIFYTTDKTYLIPDCTEPKWRRAVTPKLFNGEGTTLIRPAELCQQDSTLWRVINPGEFTE